MNQKIDGQASARLITAVVSFTALSASLILIQLSINLSVISSRFNTPLQWVLLIPVFCLILAFAGIIIIQHRIPRNRLKNMLITGQLILLPGAFLCYFADNILMMGLGMAVTTVGTVFALISGYMILDRLGNQYREQAFAITAFTFMAGIASGELIGGLITSSLTYNRVFILASLPLLTALIVNIIHLREPSAEMTDGQNFAPTLGYFIIRYDFIPRMLSGIMTAGIFSFLLLIFPYFARLYWHSPLDKIGFYSLFPVIGFMLGIQAGKMLRKLSPPLIFGLSLIPTIIGLFHMALFSYRTPQIGMVSIMTVMGILGGIMFESYMKMAMRNPGDTPHKVFPGLLQFVLLPGGIIGSLLMLSPLSLFGNYRIVNIPPDIVTQMAFISGNYFRFMSIPFGRTFLFAGYFAVATLLLFIISTIRKMERNRTPIEESSPSR